MRKIIDRQRDDDNERQAVNAAKRAGLRGDPDVLHEAKVPDVIMETVRRGEEAMRRSCADRTSAHKADIAFLLSKMHLMLEPAQPAHNRRPTTEDEERAARAQRRHLELQARVRETLSKIYVAQREHAAELNDIAGSYNRLISEQVEAWRSRHPHRRHLGSLAVPTVQVPPDALDFGQAALVRAVRSASDGAGELGWFGTLGEGDAA